MSVDPSARGPVGRRKTETSNGPTGARVNGLNRPTDGNRLPAESPADGVDGVDETVASFDLLPIVAEQGELGRREHQPVADEPQVPDSHPPGPGQQQGLAGGREQARRPDRGRTGAACAVGVVQDDGYALRRPPPSAQLVAGALHQPVEGR